MKKISVIIPCYNATKWLPKCFVTLAGQTMGMDNMELFFVNDASTDDGATWAMLQELERAYPDSIGIIDLPENMRQGGARNVALQYVSGEYIAFVDADDFVDTGLFEYAYRRAKEHQADIVQFNHDFYFEEAGIVPNQKEMADELFVIHTDEERKKLLMSEKITYGCWNKLYKRELVERAGVRYAEHVVYEEPLFVYPLLYYGTRYVTMHEHMYLYRQNRKGTMWNDMRTKDTLLQHANVQLQVWNFMKKTAFFERFYEEIKLYFLHTYFYETLLFARRRGMETDMELYQKLVTTARQEVPDLEKSIYEELIPAQMRLYRHACGDMTKELLEKIIVL